MVEKGGGGGRDGECGRTVTFSDSETRPWSQGGQHSQYIL